MKLLPTSITWQLAACGVLTTICTLLAVAHYDAPAEDDHLYLEVRSRISGAVAERGSGGGNRPYQQIREQGGEYRLEFGFLNFNRDPLRLALTLPVADLVGYRNDYSYSPAELNALVDWQKKALEEAYRKAVEEGLGQEDYDRMATEAKAEYRRRHKAFLLSRGYKFVSGNTISIDIPAMVRRNVDKTKELAVALSQMAQTANYGTDEILGASLAMVQTAFQYAQVPVEFEGRMTGGVTPPLATLTTGKGDCDSKTAFLAALLLNWDRIKLVGVGVPNHYLLAVLRNPAKGEAYIEYEGLRYVLMEPAGPGWLPLGAVSPDTLALLNAGSGVSLEALTAN